MSHVLPLAFLVYREESEEALWTARSVLTGHIAESTTASGAIGNLQRAIDAAIHAAGRMGVSAEDWYRAQTHDDVEYLEAFARTVSLGECKRERVKLKSARCMLEASIAQTRAA